MNIRDALDRHSRIALHFSGGKDSLACLYLLEAHWHRINVMWVNTGAAFPETIEQMQQIRAMVPNFVEIRTDQPSQADANGTPTDLLNVWDAPLGRMLDGSRTRKMQAPIDCCRENIWLPMQRAMIEMGITLIIRGQRLSEAKKSPIRSGYVESGVEYLFPIEDWSHEDVINYLGNRLPEHYRLMNSSLDCWSCTAYMSENKGKVAYMKARHPALHAQNQRSMAAIIEAVKDDLEQLRGLYG